jgi:transcription elongation factor Elf1
VSAAVLEHHFLEAPLIGKALHQSSKDYQENVLKCSNIGFLISCTINKLLSAVAYYLKLGDISQMAESQTTPANILSSNVKANSHLWNTH